MDSLDVSLDVLRESFRGLTPHNIEEKCLQLCKDYLSENWSEINLELMEFRRIKGGLTNQIFYCSLPSNIWNNHKKPNEVLIKFYQKKHTFIQSKDSDVKDDRFNDNVISLMIAIHGLGPKIYGIFSGGIIMEYIRGRTLNLMGEDNENKLLLGKIAQKLAHIHSLEIPIEKKPNSFFDLMRKYLNEGNKRFPLQQLQIQYKCHTMLKTDFVTEIQWIETCIKACEMPVVFSHNDFRQSNILLEGEAYDNIIFIDFEYSSYGFRAMDFGILCTEFNRTSLLFPDFPKEEIIVRFLEEYRNESIKIFGNKFRDNVKNSVENLLFETKISYISQILYQILFFIKSGEEIGLGLTKEYLMKVNEKCVKYYLELKQKFIAQNIEFADSK